MLVAEVDCRQPKVLRRGVFEMERSIQLSEQRLLQASRDLRNQLAEVQKLRAVIQSAEGSKRSLTDPKTSKRLPDVNLTSDG